MSQRVFKKVALGQQRQVTSGHGTPQIVPNPNAVIIVLTSVRTSADCTESSSTREFAYASFSLTEASSCPYGAWWLVKLALTTHGRVHSAQQNDLCYRAVTVNVADLMIEALQPACIGFT